MQILQHIGNSSFYACCRITHTKIEIKIKNKWKKRELFVAESSGDAMRMILNKTGPSFCACSCRNRWSACLMPLKDSCLYIFLDKAGGICRAWCAFVHSICWRKTWQFMHLDATTRRPTTRFQGEMFHIVSSCPSCEYSTTHRVTHLMSTLIFPQ